MNQLFLDIESIPCQAPGALEEIRKSIQPTGNMSKAETIAKWYDEKADDIAEEQWRKTALDGTRGEIICIGWALNDGPVQSLYRGLDMPEADLINRFFFDVVSSCKELPVVFPTFLPIGHNILGFDLRFIFQRSVINRVKPLFPLPHDTRYNGDRVHDVMLAWAGWGNYVSLAKLCAALGIQVKTDGIDGSMVWDFVKAGRVQEVAAYCEEDVAAVREVYRRMTFAEVAA